MNINDEKLINVQNEKQQIIVVSTEILEEFVFLLRMNLIKKKELMYIMDMYTKIKCNKTIFKNKKNMDYFSYYILSNEKFLNMIKDPNFNHPFKKYYISEYGNINLTRIAHFTKSITKEEKLDNRSIIKIHRSLIALNKTEKNALKWFGLRSFIQLYLKKIPKKDKYEYRLFLSNLMGEIMEMLEPNQIETLMKIVLNIFIFQYYHKQHNLISKKDDLIRANNNYNFNSSITNYLATYIKCNFIDKFFSYVLNINYTFINNDFKNNIEFLLGKITKSKRHFSNREVKHDYLFIYQIIKDRKNFGINLLDIAVTSTPINRLKLVEHFRGFGNNLYDVIEQNINDTYLKELFYYLYSIPVVIKSKELKKSFDESNINGDDVIISIIATSNNKQLENIKSNFERLYKQTLISFINKKPNDNYKELLLSLLECNRDESDEPNKNFNDKFLWELKLNGLKKIAKDKELLIELFVKCSKVNFCVIYGIYKKNTGINLLDIIEKELKGNIGKLIWSIAYFQLNPNYYYCKVFKRAIENNDLHSLNRCLIHMESINSTSIINSFYIIYKCSMKQYVIDNLEANTVYKKCVIKLIEVLGF